MILAPADVPVEPTPPEAIEWLLEELSKPEYQAAQQTLVDRIAKAFFDWLNDLLSGVSGAVPDLFAIVVVMIVVAALVVLFIVFGKPRLNRRSAAAPGALFGDEDVRDAAQLRRDAEAAAARGDWVTAIADRFRAVARAVADRELVPVLPGTTAHEFARGAVRPFPAEAAALAEAASAFDAVRYLSQPGSEAAYRSLAALDDRLRAARSALAAAGAAPAPVEPPR